MTTSFGTAAFAATLIAMPPTPSASNIQQLVGAGKPSLPKTTTSIYRWDLSNSADSTQIYEFDQLGDASRPTTRIEEIIGELRSWNLLREDWDGEGAHAPSKRSIKVATEFAREIPAAFEDRVPDPMLLSSGNVSLVWKEANFYADLEFLPDGRIAYYAERNLDKHKGITHFGSSMPPVLKAIIGT